MELWDAIPMFSHSDIWNGIDRLAENNRLSTSGLAKKAGLDPTSFNKSKRFTPEGKPRWPSTESIAKILAVTNTTLSDMATLAREDTKETQKLTLSKFVKNTDHLDKIVFLYTNNRQLMPLFPKGTLLALEKTDRPREDMRVFILYGEHDFVCSDIEQVKHNMLVLKTGQTLSKNDKIRAIYKITQAFF